MTGRVFRARRVARDLDGIFVGICLNNGVEVAVAQLRRLEAAMARLGDFPRLGRQRADLEGHQIMTFPVSPWTIVYKLVGDDVRVMRIVDGRRDLGSTLRGKS
ncbi:type II toxin-antitoxin system RelE/ParE family toxin [Caulobacter sp. SL161]|uniref:type II toxin-antitoxin system RelE/ParE family toxin n=1 Tax=Caulobacter sp. SL161 TaxID=2995156 RepID=UPI0022734AD2|nr:type II toxin-antitoxin system RelE/ParE family toxin [Caulobacter sp. SL161]MCY1648681.1 type II toxin-antitoxin system RelE/ParE family toxin [Caulobacter sp. SL161]